MHRHFFMASNDMLPPITAPYDAVVVPGGGQTSDCRLPVHVCVRFNAALRLVAQCRAAAADADGPVVVALSAGTPHRPPPLDARGFPSSEAAVGAAYVLGRDVAAAGAPPRPAVAVDPARVWEEGCSLDTVGNAYMCRVMHTEPTGLRRLAVVTNAFHMPRVQAVFEHVFSLPLRAGDDAPAYELAFIAVPDDGLAADTLALRSEREAASLASFLDRAAAVKTMHDMHTWMFVRHNAYAASRHVHDGGSDDHSGEKLDAAVLASY